MMKRTKVKDFAEELEFSCVLMVLACPFVESISEPISILLLGGGLVGLMGLRKKLKK
jgi:hypothetical protein